MSVCVSVSMYISISDYETVSVSFIILCNAPLGCFSGKLPKTSSAIVSTVLPQETPLLCMM